MRLFNAETELAVGGRVPDGVLEDLGSDVVSGLSLGWARDTRDDLFSPTRGSVASLIATSQSENLGGSFDARSLSLKWMGYRSLGPGYVGLHALFDASGGNPPFYLRPFVSLRGVAALSYAGERVVSLETEYRLPIRQRWDVLAFVGAGHVRADYRGLEGTSNVQAGGIGVRYRPEQLFGLTFGIDVAQGPDELATYIQIGNAWR